MLLTEMGGRRLAGPGETGDLGGSSGCGSSREASAGEMPPRSAGDPGSVGDAKESSMRRWDLRSTTHERVKGDTVTGFRAGFRRGA